MYRDGRKTRNMEFCLLNEYAKMSGLDRMSMQNSRVSLSIGILHTHLHTQVTSADGRDDRPITRDVSAMMVASR